MKKLCSILLVFVFICANILGTFAAESTATNDERVVFYETFEGYSQGAFSDSTLPHYVTAKRYVENISIESGDSGKVLKLLSKTNADTAIRFDFLNASPNYLQNVNGYKVRFKLKYAPGANNNYFRIYMNGYWKITSTKQNTTYGVLCESDKTAQAQISNDERTAFPINQELDYEIDYNRIEKKSSIKVNGKLVYNNIPKSSSIYDLDDSIYFLLNKDSQAIYIDDVSVVVTDPTTSTCTSQSSWEGARSIDFSDFSFGHISSTAGNTIGGFEYKNDDLPTSSAFIDDDETNNKYLKIIKVDTGNTMSIKRNISDVVKGYSEYELSLKIKNELSQGSCIIRLGDAGRSNSGTAVEFYSDENKMKYYGYPDGVSTGTPFNNGEHKFTKGEWTDVKIKVYRDAQKYDLQIGNAEVATNIASNFKYAGDYLNIQPQNYAKGTVCLDDIVITLDEGKKSDYTLTYDSGSVYKNEYDGNSVTANCEVAEGKAEPIVLIARYSADGKLLDIAKSGEITERTVTATLSGIETAFNDKISIMVWNSMNGLVPVKQAISLSKKTE